MERILADIPTSLTCPECSTPLVEPQESAQERVNNIRACLWGAKQIEMNLLEVVEASLSKERQQRLVDKMVPQHERMGEITGYPKNASGWLQYFTEEVQKYHVMMIDTIDHHVPGCGCVVCRNCGYVKCG